jgi:hypothetical protein
MDFYLRVENFPLFRNESPTLLQISNPFRHGDPFLDSREIRHTRPFKTARAQMLGFLEEHRFQDRSNSL